MTNKRTEVEIEATVGAAIKAKYKNAAGIIGGGDMGIADGTFFLVKAAAEVREEQDDD